MCSGNPRADGVKDVLVIVLGIAFISLCAVPTVAVIGASVTDAIKATNPSHSDELKEVRKELFTLRTYIASMSAEVREIKVTAGRTSEITLYSVSENIPGSMTKAIEIPAEVRTENLATPTVK